MALEGLRAERHMQTETYALAGYVQLMVAPLIPLWLWLCPKMAEDVVM
jgi:hypothetical protein